MNLGVRSWRESREWIWSRFILYIYGTNKYSLIKMFYKMTFCLIKSSFSIYSTALLFLSCFVFTSSLSLPLFYPSLPLTLPTTTTKGKWTYSLVRSTWHYVVALTLIRFFLPFPFFFPWSLSFLLFYFILFWDGISLCNPGWPGTFYEAQVNLKLEPVLQP